ncbi:MAG: exosortase H [Chromatiales bacterium]|nr:exosortase H [Chromatiales bacterium]
MLRFFLLFLLIQAVLFVGELTPFGQRWVVEPWTGLVAAASATLVTMFDPDVVSYGKILQHTKNHFAVSIEAGCNGIEASIVLLAAILAFPSTWKHKFYGLLAGFAAIHVLNLVRVISLFYIGQWNMDVFEWAHLYLWQALIMLDALIVFLIWLRLLPKEPEQTQTPSAGDSTPESAQA